MKVLWLTESAEEQDPTTLVPEVYTCKIVGSLGEALFDLAQEGDLFTACIVWLPLAEDEEPAVMLEELVQAKPGLPVIFIRKEGATAEAVQLLKLGAYYYFDHKPDKSALAQVLSTIPKPENPPHAGNRSWRQMLVGNSSAMQHVAQIIDLIAPRRSTVLILGETGTGKEVVARAIHEASPRSGRQIVTVNCAAIPDTLLEAELFGHVKGAFTGATNARIGRFEQANQSTLFLDEVGDLPLDLQAKLLRVLQEREFSRVGSSETIQVDVRLVAATNLNLQERVKQGKFREDLYYRLNVVPIRIQPLRERTEDIPDLVRHFLKKICSNERIPLKTVSHETLDRLTRYPWPGNVRQLENAVEMAVVLSGDRKMLIPADFSLSAEGVRKPASLTTDQMIHLPEDGIDFETVIGRIELNLLEQALQRAKGNKKLAADMLGLKRTTLAAKLKSLELLVCS